MELPPELWNMVLDWLVRDIPALAAAEQVCSWWGEEIVNLWKVAFHLTYRAPQITFITSHISTPPELKVGRCSMKLNYYHSSTYRELFAEVIDRAKTQFELGYADFETSIRTNSPIWRTFPLYVEPIDLRSYETNGQMGSARANVYTRTFVPLPDSDELPNAIMSANKSMEIPFHHAAKLLRVASYRKSWDSQLQETIVLVEIDKNTDVTVLLYESLDCVLLRSFLEARNAAGQRVLKMYEQSVPRNIAGLARLAMNAGLEDVWNDEQVLVDGSGLMVEELGPNSCRVTYQVQIAVTAREAPFVDSMVASLAASRSACLDGMAQFYQRNKAKIAESD